MTLGGMVEFLNDNSPVSRQKKTTNNELGCYAKLYVTGLLGIIKLIVDSMATK